jgi:predicted aspartyl protease
MKIKRMVFILILLLFIGGCNIIKTLLLLKSGKIENKFFTEIIHYENRATLIIVHPEIKGKQYNFILDTGATTVISEEIVNDLNLEIKSIVNSGDSQNNTSKTAFTLLPKLKIGNLCFKNIGTAIIDFNKITEIQCLDIDGIIGANIMKLAKWQIDYQNHTLTVSDDFNNLDMSGDEIVLHFTTNVSGTPLVELNLPANKTVKDVFIDTGMDRSITLSQKYYKKLLDNFPDMKVVKGFGSTSASAFGYSQDSVYYAKLPQIKLDELEISNIVIEFKGENHNLIGNEILNNYTVSFDWETKQTDNSGS